MMFETENMVTFAQPMIMRIGMETITLSYEPGSDFAKALDELIRNSEGVRVVRRKQGKESVEDLINSIIENAPQDVPLTDEEIQEEVNAVRYEQLLERFVNSRPDVPLLSEEEIMEELKAVRYKK